MLFYSVTYTKYGNVLCLISCAAGSVKYAQTAVYDVRFGLYISIAITSLFDIVFSRSVKHLWTKGKNDYVSVIDESFFLVSSVYILLLL